MKTLLRSLSGLLIGLAGRRLVARAARALTMQVRLDVQNDMEHNGELMVQRTALRHASDSAAAGDMVVIDAGANVGDWSRAFRDAARSSGVRVRIVAFEPVAATFRLLVDSSRCTWRSQTVSARLR
jgi:hypothetical protein